jgi:hypothetical protein
MRWFLIIVVLFVSSSAAYADIHFSSPGWYEYEDGIDGYFLMSGPYAYQATCQAYLRPGDEYGDFYCQYFASRPSWDY